MLRLGSVELRATQVYSPHEVNWLFLLVLYSLSVSCAVGTKTTGFESTPRALFSTLMVISAYNKQKHCCIYFERRNLT